MEPKFHTNISEITNNNIHNLEKLKLLENSKSEKNLKIYDKFNKTNLPCLTERENSIRYQLQKLYNDLKQSKSNTINIEKVENVEKFNYPIFNRNSYENNNTQTLLDKYLDRLKGLKLKNQNKIIDDSNKNDIIIKSTDHAKKHKND